MGVAATTTTVAGRRLGETVTFRYTIETTQGAAAAIQAKITNNMKTDFGTKLAVAPGYAALKTELGTASVSTVASPVISATLPTTMKATTKKAAVTTKKAVVTTKKAVVTKKANSTNNTTRKGVVADHALPVAVLSNMLAITLTVLHCI